MHKQLTWQKGDTAFYVTMDCYDGAETCELVGSFFLSQLQNLNIIIRLQGDNKLAILNATLKDTENIKKEICCTTIKANK